MTDQRLIQLEIDLEKAENRIAQLEQALGSVADAVEWMAVRFGKSSDKRDLSAYVLPQLDEARKYVPRS